jgi:hypothetical protein
MKKIVLSAFLLFLLNTSFSQKKSFIDILSDVAQALTTVKQDEAVTYQNIMYQKVIVNSITNANWSGGHDRVKLKLNIPPNTIKWYYRITVLNKTQDFDYQENETLHYSLINKRELNGLITNSIPINCYIVNGSGLAQNFLLGRQFQYDGESSVLNTNSFYWLSGSVSDNLWMCLQNLSQMDGANIIVEVVAVTKKSKVSVFNSIQSQKQINDAKELFDLGVINRYSYDSIVRLYSPKLTKDQALEILRDNKRKLDAGQITQEEYNKLLSGLKPFLNN